PTLLELPHDNRVDLSKPRFLVSAPKGWSGTAVTAYAADDGLSLGYRRGERSRIDVRLTLDRGTAEIHWHHLESGFGSIEPTFAFVEAPSAVRVNGDDRETAQERFRFTGREIALYVAT